MPDQIAQYGRLRLHYGHNGTLHTASVAITELLDPSNFSACQSAADDLALALCNIQPPTVTYTYWDIQDPYGAVINSGPFTGTPVGVHAPTGDDWQSFTITFTGKEIAPGPDGKRGNAEIKVFTGNAIPPSAGQQYFTVADDIALPVVATFLSGDLRFWAGFHGIKASVRAGYPIQFNAHTQRTNGA